MITNDYDSLDFALQNWN